MVACVALVAKSVRNWTIFAKSGRGRGHLVEMGDEDWWLNPDAWGGGEEKESLFENWWENPDAWDELAAPAGEGNADGIENPLQGPNAAQAQVVLEPLEVYQDNAIGIRTQSFQLNPGEGWLLQGQADQGGFQNIGGAFDAFLQDMETMLQTFFNGVSWEGNTRYSVAIRARTIQEQLVEVFVRLPADPNVARLMMLEAIGNKLKSVESIRGSIVFTFSAFRIGAQPLQLAGGTLRFGMLQKSFLKEVNDRLVTYVACDQLPNECFLEFCVYLMYFRRMTLLEGKDLYQRATRMRFSEFQKQHVSNIAAFLRGDAAEIRHWNDATVEVVEKAEQYFECRIFLFSLERGFEVIYEGSSAYTDCMYGCVWSTNTAVKHVDAVPRLERFLLRGLKAETMSRFCISCFQFYTRKRGCAFCAQLIEEGRSLNFTCSQCHACTNSCLACRRIHLECSSQSDDARQIRCECGAMCNGAVCYGMHASTCRRTKRFALCGICGAWEHSGSCDYVVCQGCDQPVARKQWKNHNCVLKPSTLRKPSEKIACYDFECYVDENGEHVPYLLVVWFVYNDPVEEQGIGYWSKYRQVFNDRYVYVFFDENLSQFGTFLKLKVLKDYCFLAHNGKAYDHVILQAMLLKAEIPYEQTRRGRKILELNCPSLRLTFRDTLCFIPTSLRDMPKNFGIQEFAKGHFPHRYMTKERVEELRRTAWIGPKPTLEEYIDPFFTRWGRSGQLFVEEVTAFYEKTWPVERTVWDVRHEAILYCVSDVLVLGEVVQKFRSAMADLTRQGCGLFLDPFKYMTLPSAVFDYYMACCMNEGDIAVIDRYRAFLQQQRILAFVTTAQLSWKLDNEERLREGCKQLHTQNHALILNRLFVFRNCYETGCVTCVGQGVHARSGRAFSTLSRQFDQYVAGLTREYSNYTLIVLTEHEWEVQKLEPRWAFASQSWECLKYVPLDPRQAYKGGKVETYCVLNNKHSMAVDDVVSLYPSMMLGTHFSPSMHVEKDTQNKTPFPVGLAVSMYEQLQKNRLRSEFRWESMHGVASVLILPPRNLYAPLLSYRVPSLIQSSSYETLYGLCRSCMESRQQVCTHEDPLERAIHGTFTTVEIAEAVSIGYTVLQVADIWKFEKASTDLFRTFLIPFIRAKVCSKRDGLVDDAGRFTAMGLETVRFLESLDGKKTSQDEFQNRPAFRTVAKLSQNAVYGKFGQRERQTSHQTFFQSQRGQLLKLLADVNYEVQHVELMGNEDANLFCNVVYEQRDAATTGHFRKSDIIAAYVTAHARIYLNRRERECSMEKFDVMEEPLLGYVDTDSIFRLQVHEGACPYRQGYRVGDMEPEKQGLRKWVSFGRKAYLYEDAQGRRTCKLKGVTLSQMHETTFTPERLQAMMLQLEEIVSEESLTARHRRLFPKITVDQQVFRTNVDMENARPYKKTCIFQKDTSVDVGKRVVVWPSSKYAQMRGIRSTPNCIRTVPFGFICS